MCNRWPAQAGRRQYSCRGWQSVLPALRLCRRCYTDRYKNPYNCCNFLCSYRYIHCNLYSCLSMNQSNPGKYLYRYWYTACCNLRSRSRRRCGNSFAYNRLCRPLSIRPFFPSGKRTCLFCIFMRKDYFISLGGGHILRNCILIPPFFYLFISRSNCLTMRISEKQGVLLSDKQSVSFKNLHSYHRKNQIFSQHQRKNKYTCYSVLLASASSLTIYCSRSSLSRTLIAINVRLLQ